MEDKLKKNIYCVNCGKKGHKIKNCNFPIISYGIICIKLFINNNFIDISNIINYIRNNEYDNNNIINTYNILKNIDNIDKYLYFLLINRKHTLNYIEIIRGKYDFDNIHYIINALNYITEDEKNLILNNNFDYLWNKLWSNKLYKNNFDNEYDKSKKKFNILKNGITIDNINYSFNNIINNSKIKFIETEWELPKGKKNLNETDYECSCREFMEETNINISNINILDIKQIDETFMGTNLSKYKNIYYLGQINNSDIFDFNQNFEVKKINWYTIDESLNIIRDYHFEKKNTLNYVYYYIINLINIFKYKYKHNYNN